ncbi:Mu-like prophage protein Com [compost metagenome]
MFQEFRCSKCNKLLGKIEGRAEIVCTRCKVYNTFGISPELERLVDTPETNKQCQTFLKAHNIDKLRGESRDDHEKTH